MKRYEDEGSDRIAEWMQQLSNDPAERSHRTMPDPDLLWMKAQLLDRQADAERALKPVRWFDTVTRILIGFATCWLATGLLKVVVIPAMGTFSSTLVALAASVLLAAVAMAAYPIWAGD
jgi:hypothetical protein